MPSLADSLPSILASNPPIDMPAAHESEMDRRHVETQLGDLPADCLAQVLALTSPRDAARCAAVSPSFRAAADSDDVWRRFLPELDHLPRPPPPAAKATSKKDAYLGLCDAAGAVTVGDDGGGACMKVWLEKATGARCYALSARRLSLPWDDGEFSWRWAPHPRSRFAEVAELADCTCLDIYGTLPAAALTPGTPYAAYFVYGTADAGGHRGLSCPDQETAVAVGGREVARHAVCLRPDDDDAEARKQFRGGGEEEEEAPRRREDGWWEVEMGRLCGAATASAAGDGEEVTASFEVLGWYPKRGLVVEAVEFRPARC